MKIHSLVRREAGAAAVIRDKLNLLACNLAKESYSDGPAP